MFQRAVLFVVVLVVRIQGITIEYRSNAQIEERTRTFEAPLMLKFKNPLPAEQKIRRKTGDNVELDCTYKGWPQPKVIWLKDKSPLTNDQGALWFGPNNRSVNITRAQASDNGYYTCKLNNGRDKLRRSFDLHIKRPNREKKIKKKVRRLIVIFVVISVLLLLIVLILFLIGAIKYHKMKKAVENSIFHGGDNSNRGISQLTNDPLPSNFATRQQTRALLDLVNGDIQSASREDFKELDRGQFGVIYQVRLPELGLVAAKLLPDSIRNIEHRRGRRKKRNDTEFVTHRKHSLDDSDEIAHREPKTKKAAEMLIDEMKVMHKAGNHVNIVALKKVAYPEAKLKFLFTGGPIRDEDSFYVMELCSNGSLESMLRRFLWSPSSSDKCATLSLYENLVKQPDRSMTMAQAHSQCVLTDDDLKLIAYQVACGVDYLNRRQIIHGDIAARNVLVSARFVMKICDFGLAISTTYKSYRESLALQENVQLEKKTNELPTHNLTPEFATAFLRASTVDERLILNKSSMKADVWSFGIFLWTLFLKCRTRPFNRLFEEMQRAPDGTDFFHHLAHIINGGRVLQYIDKQPEIPNDIYDIICKCLKGETDRPKMTQVRASLCRSEMLSKQAFEYYREEYNRYQGEIEGDNAQLFGEVQGVNALSNNGTDDENASSLPPRDDPDVTYHPSPTSTHIDYPSTGDDTTRPLLFRSDRNESINHQQRNDSYLQPATTTSGSRTIADSVAAETEPLISENHQPPRTTIPELPPRGRRPTPLRPAPHPPVEPNIGYDSYA